MHVIVRIRTTAGPKCSLPVLDTDALGLFVKNIKTKLNSPAQAFDITCDLTLKSGSNGL